MDAYSYPDVFVTCSATDAQRNDAKEEPTLVVEVLSPTTAAYDRGLNSVGLTMPMAAVYEDVLKA